MKSERSTADLDDLLTLLAATFFGAAFLVLVFFGATVFDVAGDVFDFALVVDVPFLVVEVDFFGVFFATAVTFFGTFFFTVDFRALALPDFGFDLAFTLVPLFAATLTLTLTLAFALLLAMALTFAFVFALAFNLGLAFDLLLAGAFVFALAFDLTFDLGLAFDLLLAGAFVLVTFFFGFAAIGTPFSMSQKFGF
ncbi:MAG: hypothetical protein VB957_02490 [Pseudomonadales bacterium]